MTRQDLQGTINANYAPFSDSTNATVVIGPYSYGRQTDVYGILLSVGGAVNVTVYAGSTQILGTYYFTAATNGDQLLAPLFIRGRASSAVKTGTITTTTGSVVVTGSGTTFTSLVAGDIIETTAGKLGRVSTIASDTTLTLDATATSIISGSTWYRGMDDIRLVKSTATVPVTGGLFYTSEFAT